MKQHSQSTLFVAATGLILTLAVNVLLSSTAQAGENPPAGKVVQLDHVRIDLAGRKIIIDAQVCLQPRRDYSGLEFLLSQWGKKTHESLLHTKARPSDIHAALLMLAIEQGKPARIPPGGGAVLPPQGPALRISLRFTDAQGKQTEIDAGRWLKSIGPKNTPPPTRWVFVGSQVLADGRYLADIEGTIVSVSNFASSVIDVPFESSDKSQSLAFDVNSQALPPLKTPVEVIITPDAHESPHARVLVELDRLGRIRAGGEDIARDKLLDWAQQYLLRRPELMVTVRTAAEATVGDHQFVADQLELAGVKEIYELFLQPHSNPLPRTSGQARNALRQWKADFADAKRKMVNPAVSARAELERIEKETARIERLKMLWREYAAHLRQQLNTYEAVDGEVDLEAESDR